MLKPIPRLSRQTPAIGFSIDIVGYSRRSSPEREWIQRRFRAMIEIALAALGLKFEEVAYDQQGDRISIFLPADTDPTHALPHLLAATASSLSADNEQHDDRLRARMAVGFGLFGKGPTGFTGQLIIDLCRLTETDVIRAALDEHPRSDVMVLVSERLYDLTIRSGHLSPARSTLRYVRATAKDFTAHAWLWVGPTSRCAVVGR